MALRPIVSYNRMLVKKSCVLNNVTVQRVTNLIIIVGNIAK